MKKLLNTLYVTAPDVYLSLDGENVVILRKDEVYILNNTSVFAQYGQTKINQRTLFACFCDFNLWRIISIMVFVHFRKRRFNGIT